MERERKSERDQKKWLEPYLKREGDRERESERLEE